MKFKLLLMSLALITAQALFPSMKKTPPPSPKKNEPHKIVYLISPPRSLSVAFMRTMAARGDFAIIHEPSQLPMCKQKGYTQAEEWFTKEAASCFQDVTDLILEKAKSSNVFVKEMGTAAELLLHDNPALVNNPNVYFVFLMRNPHHTIISFSKKSTISGDAEAFSHFAGYKVLYELFTYLSQHAKHKPYLMLTEDLYNNPEQTIKDFCAYLNIPYLPQALQWESLGSEFTGEKEWGEVKKAGPIQHWHATALKSTSLEKPQQYKVDAKGKPTFEEIENPEYKKVAIQAYQENLPYYNQLLKAYNIQNEPSHKIVYLISPPRSPSTEFLRMMAERGDFEIFHQPSQLALCKKMGFTHAECWYTKEAAPTFEQVKERILKEAAQSNVFVNETSFAMHQFLMKDDAWVKNPQTYFIFLISNPYLTVMDYYEKKKSSPQEAEIETNSFSYLVGYKALYELFEHLNTTAAHKPYLILTEDLYTKPENTIKKFSEYLHIPFMPESLSWPALGEEFTGEKEWREVKHKHLTHHWHGEALKSTRFEKPAQAAPYKTDTAGNPTFEEITNPVHKKIVAEAYQENLKYYDLLRKAYTSQAKTRTCSKVGSKPK